MRMVRRLYDEDSSVEDSEDYPLYRIPRLHGGHGLDAPGPSGLQHADAESSAEEDNDEDFAGVFPERHYAAQGLHFDEFKFLPRLHYPGHKFGKEEKRTLRHRCRACESDRLGPKVKCTQCGVFVHNACITSKNLPLPCIYPTPMPVPNPVDLRESLIYLPVELPRVPAILTKCFYELQIETRITKFHLYTSDEPGPQQRLLIERLYRKLRRDVNRNLASVPTEMISACVLRFLQDVRTQLFSRVDDEFFSRNRILFNLEPDTALARLNAHVEEVMTEHHRAHTLAALMLHLHTVLIRAYKNKLTKEGLFEIFRFHVSYIDLLFLVDPKVWLRKLDAPNEFVEPPPAAPRRWCV